MCWPKKITDGLKFPPSHDPNCDHMSLCPLHGGCGDWLPGYDLTGRHDIRGKKARVVDHRHCVELCKSISGCNAIAYVEGRPGRQLRSLQGFDYSNQETKSMCYPKSVPSRPGRSNIPNTKRNVDFMQLCPVHRVQQQQKDQQLQLQCGTWIDGYDRPAQGDIRGSAKVRELYLYR